MDMDTDTRHDTDTDDTAYMCRQYLCFMFYRMGTLKLNILDLTIYSLGLFFFR